MTAADTRVDLSAVIQLNYLIPAAWRDRLAVALRDDNGVDVIDRATGLRVAAVVPAGGDTWACADGNMVTEWRTFEDAVLYAAEPRDRPRNVGACWWRRLFRRPGPDILQCCDGELSDWPDDPYWSALFDSTVWDPNEEPIQ